MTIGAGEVNRFIVISPGSRSFEAHNPGALYVALSRARSAGSKDQYPDFAWNPNVLVNEDRLCYKVNNATSRARQDEVSRLHKLAEQTRRDYHNLDTDATFLNLVQDLRTEE